MANLDFLNSLKIVKTYLNSLGYSSKDLVGIIDEDTCTEGFIQQLSATCILPGNRSESEAKGNTYHIAITGSSMKLFFSEQELQSEGSSTEDEQIKVKLLNINLNHLEYLNEDAIRKSKKAFIQNEKLEFIESYTVKKIAKRKKQTSQVQLSKLSKDEMYFQQFRKMIYTNDTLICFKTNEKDVFIILCIPASPVNNVPIQGYTEIVSEDVATYLKNNNLMDTSINLIQQQRTKAEQAKNLLEITKKMFEVYTEKGNCVYGKDSVFIILNDEKANLIIAKSLLGCEIRDEIIKMYGQLALAEYQLKIEKPDLCIVKSIWLDQVVPKDLSNFINSQQIEVVKLDV